MPNTIHHLTESIGEVLSNLDALVQLTSGTSAFVNALGWELPPGVDDIGLTAIDFTNLLQKLKVVTDSSSEELKNEILMASRIADLGLAIGTTADRIQELADSLALLFSGFDDYIDRTNIHKELPRRMLDLLLIKQLADRAPLTTAILNFLNLIEFKYFAADPENFQIEHMRAIVHYDHLKSFLDDPAGHISNVYGWGTPQFTDILLLERLGQIVRQLGLPIQNYTMDPRAEMALVGPPPTGPDVLPAPQMNVTIHEQIGEIVGLKLGCSVFGVRPTAPGGADGGIGFLPIIRGDVQGSLPFFGFDDAFLDLSVEGDLLRRVALIIRAGQELTVKHGGGLSEAVTGRFAFGLRHGSRTSEAKTLLSFPGGVGIQTQEIYLQGGVDKFSDQPAESFVELGMLGSRVVFSLDDADSFLSESIAQDKIDAPFDFRAGWNREGVYFNGSSGLIVSLPAHAQLGPFTLEGVTLGLNVQDAGLVIESSVSGHLTLGPLTATVQRLGLNVVVSFERGNIGIFDLSPHFKAPSGIGLSIDGGGFKGGGFLGFEPEAARYSGMLELEFQDQFTLKAFGLIETRLPNGAPGFALVIVISAEFTPVQLGFGFTLNGVGGLLGLNRTVNVDRLTSGIRDQTLSSILFPTNIIANADRILSDLRQVFPAQRGRFIFGPMAKLAWGTPALLTADVGLVLEVPEPVRLIMLGVVRGILPDEKAAILRLQVNFLGVIDFTQERFSFDASLFDSKLLSFTLTGDMAMRLYWGANANFLTTVGGFHPAYQPPPMNLPALRRLTLALVSGDNPRLTLETYFAVTSNTAQFGARLELYAAAWKFNAYGFLSFDVLFQFNPFYFVADVTAMLALRVGSSSIASIKVTLKLEGPTPWKAQGDARLKLCWFLTVKIHFSKTFGETRNTTLPDLTVLPLVVAALTARDNWTEERPSDQHRLESLRALPTGAAEPVRVHPVGTLAISQKVVPLGIQIDRIGAQRPADARTFAIDTVVIGSDAQGTPEAAEESFAPAQYFDLSDDEKLASPSFKTFTSGIRVGEESRMRTGYAAAREVKYELKFIDSARETAQPQPGGSFDLDVTAFGTWTLQGATAKSDLSFARRRKSTLAPDEVNVVQEPFAVVHADNLAPFDAGSVMGTERAALKRRDAVIAANPALRGSLQVVPLFEMST
jgi:Family of unknown function (DUF6603)